MNEGKLSELLARGAALARTPEEKAKVEWYVAEAGRRLRRCRKLLDEMEKMPKPQTGGSK